MKSTIKYILALSVISIFFISCTTTSKNNSLTLRQVSVLSEEGIELPKREVK